MREPLRIAVLCDYVQENWPSMENAADVLVQGLRGVDTSVARIQPAMSRPLTKLFPRQKAVWNAERTLNRFLFYPGLARKLAGFDLFHVVDHSYAQLVHSLDASRTLVTCHDLDTFRCLLDPASEPRSAGFRLLVKRTLSGLGKAGAVICVSETTRARLLESGLADPSRVYVVPNAIRPEFRSAPNEEQDAIAARLLGPPSTHTDLLHVGSTIPRKRIDVLLRVFAECARSIPNLRLVRVGGPFTPDQNRLACDLGIDGRVVSFPFLRPEVLAAVYRRAALVLIPSDAEGFGLPLAEAMACGVPAVASDIAALREVSAGAASHCAVGDIEKWSETVGELLAERRESPVRWNARRERGCARAAAFAPDQYAQRMLEIYRGVLACRSAQIEPGRSETLQHV